MSQRRDWKYGGQSYDDRQGRPREHSTYNYCPGSRQTSNRERSPVFQTRPGWWKVTVVNGYYHQSDWLLSRIKGLCRVHFNEINFHTSGNDSIFFVNDGGVAGALIDTSNRIVTRNGSRIIIRATACNNTRPHYYKKRFQGDSQKLFLNRDEIGILYSCISQRHDPMLLKLDLSRIALDPSLKELYTFVDAASTPFFNEILDYSFCPKLKVMNLSNNYISMLDHLVRLALRCPELEELILSDNEISQAGELRHIKNHTNLKRLWLKGNPVARHYTGDRNGYILHIRKQLPNITFLDGEELPPQMRVVLDDEIEGIPSRKDVYAPNKKDLELIKEFVQKYFMYYDYYEATGDRVKLLEMYHNNATFSLCCDNLRSSYRSCATQAYTKKSRNLIAEKFTKTMKTHLIRKKVNIVSFLNELPQTDHWIDSFTLDVTVATPQMLGFTVQGIFMERNDETPRGFTRTVITQRVSESVLIITNEIFSVRNLTGAQVLLIEDAKYNNAPPAQLFVSINIPDTEPDPPPIPQIVVADESTTEDSSVILTDSIPPTIIIPDSEPSNQSNRQTENITVITIPDDSGPGNIQPNQVVESTHEQLIKNFAKQLSLLDKGECSVSQSSSTSVSTQDVYSKTQQDAALRLSIETNMNLKFSIMCLEASEWYYEEALRKFSDLNKRKAIPAEAFVHDS